jgi:hypothetical protein
VKALPEDPPEECIGACNGHKVKKVHRLQQDFLNMLWKVLPAQAGSFRTPAGSSICLPNDVSKIMKQMKRKWNKRETKDPCFVPEQWKKPKKGVRRKRIKTKNIAID